MKENNMNRLTLEFYSQSAIELAPLFLGKLLCRKIDNTIIKARITETEAYFGESDTACHAHKGKTERTKILYEQGGLAYVYLCYGMHNLLNIVTGAKDFPQAVLIRGVENLNGPGKLTKFLQIDRSLNYENITTSDKLWLEYDGFIPEKYQTSPRIGIDYATEEYKNKPWRFFL